MFPPVDSCRNIFLRRHRRRIMEIDFRSAGSNDRMLEREVHFRPDRSDRWTGRREEETSKDEISPLLRSAGRYSWIIWCRKNALFSTSSRAREDLWLRRELVSIECIAALLKWQRCLPRRYIRLWKLQKDVSLVCRYKTKPKKIASIFFVISHKFEIYLLCIYIT